MGVSDGSCKCRAGNDMLCCVIGYVCVICVQVIELEGLLHESQDVVRLRGDELSNLQLQLATKQAELAVGMAEMDQLRLRLQEQEGQLQQSASEAAELTAELESARKQVRSHTQTQTRPRRTSC